MLARPDHGPLDAALSAEMLRAVPRLRAYAISLCRDVCHADDLVQGALLLAIVNIGQFEPGTNMLSWMMTILRNELYSDYRRRRREVGSADDHANDRRFSAGGEHDEVCRLDWARVEQLIPRLPRDHREALMLVVVQGASYEAAADAIGVAPGTIKSRVNRAREALAGMMDSYALDWVRRPACAEEAAAWDRIVGSGALDEFQGT